MIFASVIFLFTSFTLLFSTSQQQHTAYSSKLSALAVTHVTDDCDEIRLFGADKLLQWPGLA